MSQNGTSPNVKLHVLIVGAGIAGLSAARALRLCGHSVEIFERSKFANEVGAAVTITPNGTRVLRELGMDFKTVGGVNIRSFRVFNAQSLDVLIEHEYGVPEELYGAPHQAFHRQDLHRELLRLACLDKETPGPLIGLHKGVNVTNIDVQNASLELDDGRTFKGDLLIGADGLHSNVRAAALGKRTEPIDSEWQIYRFLLPTEKVMKDEVLRSLKPHNARIVYEDIDNTKSDARLVWYECRNGEVHNFACFYRGSEDETKVEDFGNEAVKSKVLRLFGNFNPKILRLFNQASHILYWRVYEREPLPTFIYGHSILVGDAGHAMTPFTAAGATQGLEDAGALLGLLKDLKGKEETETRLALYDSVRLVRASRIQLGSSTPYKDGKKHPLADEYARIELLDKDLPDDLKGLGPQMLKRMNWDMKYDVFEKCREALANTSNT